MGSVFLSGPGAGGAPTAASLLDDLLAVARDDTPIPRRDTGSVDTGVARHEGALLIAGRRSSGPDTPRLLRFLLEEGLPVEEVRVVRNGEVVWKQALAPRDPEPVVRLATSVTLSVEDENQRVVDTVRDLKVDIRDPRELEKVSLKLDIALPPKD